MINNEIWKPMSNVEGFYLVSNTGRVKSLPRKVAFGSTSRVTNERILAQSDNGTGYLYVRFSSKGVIAREYVHRLVAKAFLDNPHHKEEVNHKNGIKSDNRVENLEWVSNYENKEHAYLSGLSRSKPTDISVVEVSMILDLLKTKKYTKKEIGDVFSVPKSFLAKLEEENINTDKDLKKIRRNKRSHGYDICIFDKMTKENHKFNSAKQAAAFFGRYDGYFSEIITKNKGENSFFIAQYEEEGFRKES